MPVSLNEDKVVTASAGIKSNELPCAMRKNYTTFEAFWFFFKRRHSQLNLLLVYLTDSECERSLPDVCLKMLHVILLLLNLCY